MTDRRPLCENSYRWLKTLRDDGPKRIRVLFSKYPGAQECLGLGLTHWNGSLRKPERITPAGLEALARWEAEND